MKSAIKKIILVIKTERHWIWFFREFFLSYQQKRHTCCSLGHSIKFQRQKINDEKIQQSPIMVGLPDRCNFELIGRFSDPKLWSRAGQLKILWNLRKKSENTDDSHNFRSSFVEPQVGFSIVQFFQIQRFPAIPNRQFFFNFLQKNYKIPIALKISTNLNFSTAFLDHYFAHCFFFKGFVFKLTSERLIKSWVSFVHFSFGPAMANPRLFSTLLNHYFAAKSTNF